MVYNIWNDPEIEIVEAAISRYIDNIDDEDIMLTVKALKEPYPKDIEGYENIRAKLLIEMRDTYFIDIENCLKRLLNTKMPMVTKQLQKQWFK